MSHLPQRGSSRFNLAVKSFLSMFRESGSPLRPRSARPHTLTPHLEPLEDRRMLSVTLFVDADAPTGGGGLAWATAYDNLQSALESAAAYNADEITENDVDAIWIAEGVYRPTAELEAGDPRSVSFSLGIGVTLYGGFAGTETSLADRDLAAARTILSGDIGQAGDRSDNAYRVVQCLDEVTAGLDRVTVTGGNADGENAKTGGGVFVASSNTLKMTNCTVSGNSAESGGGVYVRGNATIVNSVLVGNTASRGGGIYQYYYGNLNLVNSTVTGNTADLGGGVFSRNHWPMVVNSIVAANEGGDLGSHFEGSNNLIGIDPAFVRGPSDGGDGWGDDPGTPDVDEGVNDDYGDLRLSNQSPAIDMGDSARLPADTNDLDGDGDTAEPIPLDRDGSSREFGSTVDVGAYECQDAALSGRETPSTVVTTAEDEFDLYDGDISLREAIWYAGTSGQGNVVTFDSSLADATIALDGAAVYIGKSLTVDASGAGGVTVDAGGRSGVFLIGTYEEIQVDLRQLTITGGNAYEGGGLYIFGKATLTDCTVHDNTAMYGGGIHIGNCWNEYGTLTAIGSTIFGNAADYGGGIFNLSAEIVLLNSTISGNAASENGGAILNSGIKDCLLDSTTITQNSAGGIGGGVFLQYYGTTTVRNSIVAGNTAPTDPDLDLATTEADEYSLIGGDPMLGLLADNGGPTLTHLPLEGSPAIDAGVEEYPSTYTDQRGWNRQYGTIDVGAVEVQPAAVPIAYPDGFDLDQDGGPVVFDPMTNDELWGQTGATVSISRLPEHGSLLTNLDGTYSYTPAPGFFGTDSLDYVVRRGGFTSNETSVVFSVLSPESIVVSTHVDELDADYSDGDLSLREALEMGTQIQFSADLLEQMIILDGGTLEIVADRTILGLGAPFLSVSGNDKYRVFNIAEEAVVAMDGLTVSGGWAAEGGGIGNYGTLMLTNAALLGNTAYSGGGMYNRGAATVVDSNISYNSTAYRPDQGGGDGGMGAGINNAGALTILRTTLRKNIATITQTQAGGAQPDIMGGGAMYNSGTSTITASTLCENSAGKGKGGGIYTCSIQGTSSVEVLDSTISGNYAADGGGIYNYASYGTSTLALTNSTVSGNTAGQEPANGAGGIYNRAYRGTAGVTLLNVTVTANTSGYCGGIFSHTFSSGTLLLDFTNSIVAGNISESYPDLFGDLTPESGFNFIGGDPMLGPLADNGGPTLTHLPLSGSPVLDAGNDDAVTAQTDQRGWNRFYGTVDIGAVEFHPSLPGDLNSDQAVNSTDLDLIRANWGRTVSPGSLLDGDPSGDGKVTTADLDIVRANWGAVPSAAAVDAVFDGLAADDAIGGDSAVYGPVRKQDVTATSHPGHSRLHLRALAEMMWLQETTGLHTRR